MPQEVRDKMICFDPRLEEILRKDHRDLDGNQKKAVASDAGTVVKAGAGSGKTTVLSYRFLRLVLEHKADSDQILTLTFTKKAAAEMSERIYRRLLSAGDKVQLAKFPDASISTLDSFFSQIVKSDCIRYGLTNDFSIIDDDDMSSLIRRVANRVFDGHKGSAELAALASMYSPEDLDSLILDLGQNWFTLDRHYDAASWAESIESGLKEIFESSISSVRSLASDLEGLLANPENLAEVSQAIKLCEEPHDYAAMASGLAQIKINMTRDRTKKGEGPEKKQAVDSFRSEIMHLTEAAIALGSDSVLVGVLGILCEIQDAILSSKKSSSSVSFLDVSRMAFDILKTNKTIRKYYKNKFKYIMIDEFQDNNELQKDILFLLSERYGTEGDGVPLPENLEKDKLFFVGDEKQSIYGFRGADVSVFKALGGEMARSGGSTVSLETNYRTEPALIDEFNSVFQKTMGTGGKDYEADFEKLGLRPASSGIASRMLVCCHFPKKDGSDSDDLASQDQAEASFTAGLIQRMTSTDEFLIPDGKGGTRRPSYSDIAILLRSLSRQNSYEKALRILDIPYCLQQTRALMQDAVSNDLFNVLELCLFPEDPIAYAAVLSSPLCHMDGEDFQAALSSPEPFGEAAISEGTFARYAFAREKFNQLRQMAGNSTIASLVDFIWNDWGYRYFLVTKKTSQSFMEHYDSIWLLASGFDAKGSDLSAFLSYMRMHIGSSEKLKDFELLREQSEGVNIMTIHKSKGLEFPIVIISDAGSSRSGGRGQDLLYEYKASFGNVLSIRHMDFFDGKKNVRNLFYEASSELEKAKDLAEQKRLLYVAMTRAETHLVLEGGKRKNGGMDNSLLGMAYPDLDWKTEDGIPDGPIPGSMAVFQRIPDVTVQSTFIHSSEAGPDFIKEARALYDSAVQKDRRGLPLRVAATSLEPEASAWSHPLPLFPSDAIADKHGIFAEFGTFCHRIMEESVKSGSSCSPERAMELLKSTEGLGDLSEPESKAFCSDAIGFAQGFLSSDFYRTQVKPFSFATELRFFSGETVDGRKVAVEGVIDLLVTQKDRMLVVDYKTDRSMDPAQHARQMELYSNAVHRRWNLPVRSALVYLRCPDDSPGSSL